MNMTTDINTICPICHKTHTVTVMTTDYYEWKFGLKTIDVAFPYLSADERELLISGICTTCWDKMFPSDEDEERG